MSITEAETIRIQRATEQAADYLVLPSLDDPTAFVVVGKHGNSYTVTPDGCGCPDATQRGCRCKHWWLVRSHVASLIATAEAGKRRAGIATRMATDFPED